MAKIEQILPVTGPMDDSTDSEYIQSDKGVVRRRVNMRPESIGNKMANVPILGTVMIDVDLPTGTNETVGWTNDNENEAIIWFIYNDAGDHCIYRYYTSTGEVEAIFHAESTLGFTAGSNICAEVVDGRLYWNDNTDEPKSFNIQKAVNYTKLKLEPTATIEGELYGDDDEPFDEVIFPFIKKPPRWAPELSYETLNLDPDDSSIEINFNNIRKKIWQVKYNFVYEDNQESVYSPISKVALSTGEISSSGVWTSDLITNNAIKIKINTGNNNVKSINVAVRDASILNSGPFYKFKTIDKFDEDGDVVIQNDKDYYLYFLNNTFLESIDNDYGNAYFHNIPLSAKDLLLFDSKYLGMSMPKIGYNFDENNLDYELGYVEEEIEFGSSSINMQIENYPGTGGSSFYNFTRVTIPSIFYPNSSYVLSVTCTDNPAITISGVYNSGAVEPAGFREAIRDSLLAQIEANFNSCFLSAGGAVYELGDYQIVLRKENAPEDTYLDVSAVVIKSSSSNSFKTLKRGQYHPFAIVYNDINGRYSIAFGDQKVYAPLFGSDGETVDFRQVVKPTITINSAPPIWAHTYRIAYIPRNSYTYYQVVPAVEQILGDGVDGVGVNGIPTGKYFLNINKSILAMIERYPNTIISAYEWVNGDRIRHYGTQDSYEILQEFTRTYTVTDVTYVETGYLVDVQFTPIPTTSPEKITALEIYRPNQTPQDKAYYEIGEEFEIIDPGTASRRHSGGDQDQTADLVTPAISTLDFGDSYLRERFVGDADVSVIYAEEINYNDYYASSAYNIGRPVLRTKSKEEILKRVVKTENYIENTEFNRLNIMLAGDEYYGVSEVYGDITKVLERGDTLKIIQNHKEISVYIGKNYTKDANGNDVVLVSDKTFGSDQVYKPFLGSAYPRSVVASDAYIYFFDTSSGDFLRSASNGTISLAKQYGMQDYLETKNKAFRAYSGSKDIITSISPNDNTVYLTFIMGTIETLAFSENEGNKGFMFFVEFSNGSVMPENFAWYGDYMYSFVEGVLWQHGAGKYNSFYGSSRKESSIEIVANKFPEVQKSFETISLDANGFWTAEATIEPDNHYPYGQRTKILQDMFRNREGRVIASIPRNIIGRDNVENIQKLYSGNEMTGNAMKITISSIIFDNLREVKITALNQV